MVAPPELQRPTGGWGLPQVNVNAQARNIIQLDSKVIAEELRPMVQEEVEANVDDKLNSGGRNRGNAQDQGLF